MRNYAMSLFSFCSFCSTKTQEKWHMSRMWMEGNTVLDWPTKPLLYTMGPWHLATPTIAATTFAVICWEQCFMPKIFAAWMESKNKHTYVVGTSAFIHQEIKDFYWLSRGGNVSAIGLGGHRLKRPPFGEDTQPCPPKFLLISISVLEKKGYFLLNPLIVRRSSMKKAFHKSLQN